MKNRHYNGYYRNTKNHDKYYRQLYANKFENPEEINKFLNTYNLSKLKKEEIRNAKRPVKNNEIEALISSLSIQENQEAWAQYLTHVISHIGFLQQKHHYVVWILWPNLYGFQCKTQTKNRPVGGVEREIWAAQIGGVTPPVFSVFGGNVGWAKSGNLPYFANSAIVHKGGQSRPPLQILTRKRYNFLMKLKSSSLVLIALTSCARGSGGVRRWWCECRCGWC